MSTESNFEIGAARVDITPSKPVGLTMMGWGDPLHKVKGVATSIYVRAVVLRLPARDGQPEKKLAMACLDIGLLSEALRLEVLRRLKPHFQDDEVVLSATHTHSAPGGFSDYVLYAITVDGLNDKVFETYAAGTVEAILAALKRARPGKIRFGTGEFPLNEPVAFNRSIRAWNRNIDTEKYSRSQRHVAVDREMTLLRFEAEDGTPIAAWNWFPVHGTSMHRNRYLIHSDNKGVAAVLMEDAFRKRGVKDFVAVFAQGAAGDVSPNYKRHVGLPEKRGAFRDDDASCRLNARLQSKKAIEIFDRIERIEPLPPVLNGFFEYHDLTHVPVASDLVGGKTGIRTGLAEVGVGQLYGTAEGRGASVPMIYALRFAIVICRLYNFFVDRLSGRESRWPWTDDPAQAKKITVISAGKGEILETTRIRALIIPAWAHPVIRALKRFAKKDVLKERPFVPQILPLQLLQLGSLAVVAVPGEFTTTSGRRLRRLLEKELSVLGLKRVIVQGYANAFASYVTTPEEYDQQGYEGACTFFGRWTLPAYLTLFREMGRRWIAGEKANALRPTAPSPEYLAAIRSEAVSGVKS